MLLESLRVLKIKSNLIYSIGGANGTIDNTANFRANAKRHSIIVTGVLVCTFGVGGTLVIDTRLAGPVNKLVVYSYEDFGDILRAIDTFAVSGGASGAVLETWVDDEGNE